ncbi:MAG: serine hydrolase domain-containing protein [Pyramidobacter sp.]
MDFLYTRPERQGISPRTLLRFFNYCEQEIHSLYSFAVVRGNSVVASGYSKPMRSDMLKMLHSASKSLNSMAIGIAIGDGKLSLDDRLIDFFPDELPLNHDPRVERITIRDMLKMASSSAATSKVFRDVKGSWRQFYLGLTPYAEPGEFFSYDTGAAYMLSCIVTKVMGKNTLEVLKERVFPYLDIKNVIWQEDTEGNNVGGWGCYMKIPDFVKLGRLVLNYGVWQGHQLVPEWYMREATRKQIETFRNPGTGWGYGYGYQFWIYPESRFGMFGAFGQLVVCDPKKDLFVVTSGGCTREENRRLLLIINDTIFAESCNYPISYDDVAFKDLQDRVTAWELPLANGKATSSCEKNVFEHRYVFRENSTGITSLKFTRADEEKINIELGIKGTTIQVAAGNKDWCTVENEPLLGDCIHKIHSFSYGWTSPTHLQLKQYMCNTSYFKTYEIEFSGMGVDLSVTQNISVNDLTADHLIGTWGE